MKKLIKLVAVLTTFALVNLGVVLANGGGGFSGGVGG
jgi:hypothetical protein